MKQIFVAGLCTAAAFLAAPAHSAITKTDDAGKVITLAAPAQRIISLAPHVTELLYAAGAGDKNIALALREAFVEISAAAAVNDQLAAFRVHRQQGAQEMFAAFGKLNGE